MTIQEHIEIELRASAPLYTDYLVGEVSGQSSATPSEIRAELDRLIKAQCPTEPL